MSSSEFSRSATTTESNIPVPKRPLPGARRNKGCAQLPELQRYIETIIKASSECESEEAAPSERGTGSPREKKFGRYSVCKGREKGKWESGRKSKNKAKTPFTEAVSTGGGEVASMSFSDFDDPRNWRTDGARNGGADPEIGNFLEHLFPNPYHLENVKNALPDTVPDIISEEDDSGDPVPISNVRSVRTQTEVQSESTDNAFVTPDCEIKPRSRGSIANCSIGPASSRENCNRPVSRRGGERGSNVSVGSKSSGARSLTKTPVRYKSSQSTINGSSRASSLESIGSKSRTITLKTKPSTGKSNQSSDKEKTLSDCDIGKLKLLSATDSDGSVKESENAKEEYDTSKGTTSRTFDEQSECDDLNDLRQIFDVMNKATESFFELTVKTEQTAFDVSKRNESERLMELINELTQKTIEDDAILQEERKEDAKQETTPEEDAEEALRGSITRETNLKNLLQREDINLQAREKDSDEDSTKSFELYSERMDGQEADQKIDEVLQYMYDCLKNFSKQEGKPPESLFLEDKKDDCRSGEGQERTNPNQLRRKDSNCETEEGTDHSFAKRYPRVKEIQSDSSTFVDDTKRQSATRTRSRKRQDKNSPASGSELPPNGRPSTSAKNPEAYFTAAKSLETRSTADPSRIFGDNPVQIAETQNELGSYSERAASDSPSSKSCLPQSVRLKKIKAESQKTIKEALETEERLLASFLNPKPEKKVLEKVGEAKSRKQSHAVVKSNRASYPFITDFKRSNSNFVICVSSLPRNIRAMGANKTSLTLSPSLSLSLSDITKSWDMKSLPYYSKMSLKRIPVISDIACIAFRFDYNVQQGALFVGGKSQVTYTARPFCLRQIVGCSESQEELSLKSSECLISVRMKPIKKSLFVESSRTDMCLTSQTAEKESGQRVESLLEALEKTEGRLMLLEQSEFINSETMSCCSGHGTYKCESSEVDWDGENGQEKIHDLLLRTYSLQHRLHRYLHKMTCVQSMPPCPLMHSEQCLRLSLMVNSDVSTRQESETPEEVKTVNEAVTTEVQMSDRATSYNPPAEDTENEENQNEDDDNSSVCSFKSSNDYSETAETKPPQRGEFLQKIFNEIESFKQGFMTAKKDDPSPEQSNNGNSNDNRIAEYDPKTPAKMLRTVFKGKKSMTELTIGLKDIPMTQVSNISVEKRKFSPNHTKISICILKEKPEDSNIRETMFKTNGSTLRNKFSTLYYDRMRPSLSRCRTEYSRLEDDRSKTSESINESSEDDDDDDFKSVASSPSNHEVTTHQEAADDGRKSAPPPPQKTFTKYRFDFYRKMDMSLDSAQTKPKPLPSTVCRYKELEPLKEALTEMQIRMRSIKQDTFYAGNEYYERALKLAKMSAGYCQSCGNRAVIPKDTFGYYKALLPRRHSGHRHGRHFKMAATNPSYYSFRSSNGDSFCDLDIKHSSSYLLNRPNAPFLRNSLHDMPLLIGRI